MISLDDFIKKHDGRFLEVAGSSDAKNQCVDLANGYIRDVLGLPIIEWTNAKDFPTSTNGQKYFDYIKDAQGIVPQVGDLVIWKGTIWGHIAICLFADVELPWFTSFDQNWPVGSPCHKVDHSYSNVIGWMRPKLAPKSDYYKGLDLNNKESMKIAVDVWADLKDGKLVKADDFVKIQKENLELKAKADKWDKVKQVYSVENFEALDRMITDLKNGSNCDQLLKDKDNECVKKIDDLKEKHQEQITLITQQIIDPTKLTKGELFLLFLGIKLEEYKQNKKKEGEDNGSN